MPDRLIWGRALCTLRHLLDFQKMLIAIEIINSIGVEGIYKSFTGFHITSMLTYTCTYHILRKDKQT